MWFERSWKTPSLSWKLALCEMSWCLKSLLYWDTNIVHLLRSLQPPPLSLAQLFTLTELPFFLDLDKTLCPRAWILASHSPRGQRLRELAPTGRAFCSIGNGRWKWLGQIPPSFFSHGLIQAAVPFWTQPLYKWTCHLSKFLCLCGSLWNSCPVWWSYTLRCFASF